MSHHLLCPFTAVLLFLLACNATASMGALESVIEARDDGTWQVELSNNAVQLRNGNTPGDLTYYYANSPGNVMGRRTILLDVQVPHASKDSLAGILYGFEANPKSYYLFVIAGDRTVNLLYRGNNGLENKLKTSIDIGPNSTTRLMLVEKGSKITLFANNRQVGQLTNSRLGRGATGIAAADIGTYQFSDFSVTGSDSAAVSQPSTFHDYVDPKLGMVQRRVPLPAGWRLDDNPNDSISLYGPNDIVSYRTDSGRIVASNAPSVLEAARVSGTRTGPVLPVGDYLRQYYVQNMANKGFELTNHFPMPKVQVFWELFGAGMPQGLSQKRYEAIGAEWTHSSGSRAFTILVLNILSRQNMTVWNVGASEVYADERFFESAKKVLINVAVNTEMNPQWQITMNRQLLSQLRQIGVAGEQRMRRSQISHINRMNAILEQGKASRKIADINSDIIDVSHNSYLNRSNMVARSDERFLDMISERSVISNPETGELYKVDAGATNHWVSADGIHLPSDNVLYDPRTDAQLNNRDWTQFQVVR